MIGEKTGNDMKLDENLLDVVVEEVREMPMKVRKPNHATSK